MHSHGELAVRGKNTFLRKFLIFLFALAAACIPLSIEIPLVRDQLNIVYPTEPIVGLITVLVPLYLLLEKRLFKKVILVDYIVIGIFLASGMSFAFSVYPMASVKYIITIFWYISAGYLLPRAVQLKRREWITVLVFYCGGVMLLCLYSLSNFYEYGIFYETSYMVSKPFIPQGHSNLSAAVEPALLIVTGAFLLTKDLKIKIFYLLCFMIYYAVIDYSWSRASYLTTSLFILLMFIFLNMRYRKAFLILILIGAVLPVQLRKYKEYIHEKYVRDLTAEYKPEETVKETKTLKANDYLEVLVEESPSNEERKIRWKTGLMMLKENPVTGIGVGCFTDYQVKYFNEGKIEKRSTISHFKMNIHNIYLGWLVEGGILLFGCGIFLILWIMYSGFRIFKVGKTSMPYFYHLSLRSKSVMKILLLIYFILFMIHGVVQDFSNESKIIIVFWTAVYMLSRTNLAPRRLKKSAGQKRQVVAQ